MVPIAASEYSVLVNSYSIIDFLKKMVPVVVLKLRLDLRTMFWKFKNKYFYSGGGGSFPNLVFISVFMKSQFL